jgi:hypothetical protein
VVTEAGLAGTRTRTGEWRCGVVGIQRGSLHESKDGNQGGRREGMSARMGSVSSGGVTTGGEE